MMLAAIDIGSNAARLLITEAIVHQGKTHFNKQNLFRIPLRLGFDVFETGNISEEKRRMILEMMLGFKHLLQVYKVEAVKACATSAMRDAKNAASIIKEVKEKTGIQIEVITGDMEANLVYENHIAEYLNKDHAYMYIDVGGGSTEISIFAQDTLQFKHSFNIGTIRLLKGKVEESEWNSMKDSIKVACRPHKHVVAIGSGGNINKVFSMSKKKEGKPLDLDLLKDYYKELNMLPIQDRINRYGLRDDRADVIVPALEIYINAMKWAGAEEIFVPKIGVADGLIQHLWEELHVL